MALPRIEHALFDFKIPSNGKEIKLRPMLVKDEKIILMAKPSGPQAFDLKEMFNAIKQVVQNCIVSPGISTDDLAMFDLEYAFIKLREQSVAPSIEAQYYDAEEIDQYESELKQSKNPTPPQPYKFKIELKDVEVKFNNKDMVIDGPNGIKIQMTYPKGTLYSDEGFLKMTPQEGLEYLLLNCIQLVNGETPAKEELKAWLQELPIPINDKLLAWVGNLPKLHYEVSYTNKLGKGRKIILNTLSDFFSF